MKKMTRSGLVREVRDQDGNLQGWAANRSKILETTNRTPTSRIERGKAPRMVFSMEHDREVRCALDEIKKLPLITRIITESKLKEGIFSSIRGYSKRELNRLSSLVPDAAVIAKKNGQEYHIALEMELSRKSNPRIRDKVEHYLTEGGYNLVLYVCRDTRIADHIFRNYRFVLANSAKVKFAARSIQIYSGLLGDFKKDALQANFRGLTGDFRFDLLTGK